MVLLVIRYLGNAMRQRQPVLFIKSNRRRQLINRIATWILSLSVVFIILINLPLDFPATLKPYMQAARHQQNRLIHVVTGRASAIVANQPSTTATINTPPVWDYALEALPKSFHLLRGRVSHIIDGDSLVMIVEDHGYTIRLAEIDTPEYDQPYADAARSLLSQLANGQQIVARVQDIDDYGRLVARLYREDLDINAELVKQGAAWVYDYFATDPRLDELEDMAQQQRVGIWGLESEEQVPPWVWRQRQSKYRKPLELTTALSQVPETDSSKAFNCGDKNYCRQMSSCAEAQNYLAHCGLAHMDGDGDGFACETLCREERAQ